MSAVETNLGGIVTITYQNIQFFSIHKLPTILKTSINHLKSELSIPSSDSTYIELNTQQVLEVPTIDSESFIEFELLSDDKSIGKYNSLLFPLLLRETKGPLSISIDKAATLTINLFFKYKVNLPKEKQPSVSPLVSPRDRPTVSPKDRPTVSPRNAPLDSARSGKRPTITKPQPNQKSTPSNTYISFGPKLPIFFGNLIEDEETESPMVTRSEIVKVKHLSFSPKVKNPFETTNETLRKSSKKELKLDDSLYTNEKITEDFKAQLTLKTTEIDELKAKVDSLQKQVDQKQLELNEKMKEEQLFTKIEERLEEKSKKLLEVQQEKDLKIKQLEEQIQDKLRELKSLQDRINQLEENLKDVKHLEQHDLNAKLVEEANQKLIGLEEQLKDKDFKMNELKEQLAKVQEEYKPEEIKLLKTEIETLKGENDKLRSEKSSEHVDQLNAVKKEMKSQIFKLETKIVELENREKQSAKRELEDGEMIISLRKKVEELEKVEDKPVEEKHPHSSLNDDNIILISENESLRKKLRIMEQRLSEVREVADPKEILKLQEQIKELEADKSRTEKRYVNELKEVEKRVKEEEYKQYSRLEQVHLSTVDRLTRLMDFIQTIKISESERVQLERALK